MKKLYTIISLVITTLSATSQVIITEIADPNNSSKSRFIELTNIGQNAFDLNGYNLIRWTNSNTDPTASSEKDLSSYGSIPPGTILTFAANATEFEATYGFAPTDNFGTGGVADSNGDDNIALRNGTTIYDIFGVPGVDGTNTAHEFEDGRAERKASVTAPSSTWVASEWNIDNDSGGGDGAQDAPSGYDPGSWVGFSGNTTPNLGIQSPSNNVTIYSNSLNITLSIENFSVANGSGDGHIHYTLDGGSVVMKYDTDPITLTNLGEGNHILVFSLVDNNHNALDPAVEATLNFTVDIPTQVSNISALRQSNLGEAIEVVGEAVLTYKQSFRNAKVFQDDNAGIYVDDSDGVITTTYELGDGVTGITGTLSEYNGLLQFTPISDPGVASSSANTVNPVTLTLAQLTASGENYESQLVRVEDVTISGDNGETTFINGKTYSLTNGSDTFPLRTTFYNFNGEDLPTSASDFEGIINERSDVGLHLAPRNFNDITLTAISFDKIQLNLYPNPAQTTLNLSGYSSPVKISVFDMLGKQHIETEVINTLDVSALKPGFYMVEIKNETRSKVFKIIKQ